MTPIHFDYPEGATPLDPDEAAGLIPKHVATQGELNEVEQHNILKAQHWSLRKKPKNLLTDTFFRDLHRRMFGDVWKWAGQYRNTGKNLGVPFHQIPTALAELLADTSYWIENKSYGWDELGARFHHRAVCIHAFPNGNGRHARLITDMLLTTYGEKPFSWGANTYTTPLDRRGELRMAYLTALREADTRKFEKLIAFVRN